MNIPGTGYVGVGEVTDSVVPVDNFQVEDGNGQVVPITALPLDAAEMTKVTDNPEKAEHLVRVASVGSKRSLASDHAWPSVRE